MPYQLMPDKTLHMLPRGSMQAVCGTYMGSFTSDSTKVECPKCIAELAKNGKR